MVEVTVGRMLRIYWAKKPTYFIDEVLPKLLNNGELTKKDIEVLFDRAGIGSYDAFHINLGINIRLFERGEQVFYLAPDATEEVRIEEPGVRTFDFLTRLPHFRRWLELTHLNQQKIKPDDLLIKEERNSKERRKRLDLFENWKGSIRQQLETKTMKELLEDIKNRRIYIRDKYLLGNDSDLPLRAAVLCTIGAAAKQGAAITPQNIADLYDVEISEIKEIIHEVLEPVGCPLTEVDGGYTLDRDLLYITSKPDMVTEIIDDCVGSELELKVGEAVKELATAIEQYNNPFMYIGKDSVDFDIEVSREEEQNLIYKFDGETEDRVDLDRLHTQTQQRTRVVGPRGVPEVKNFPLTAIRNLLEDIEEKGVSSIDDALKFHLRSKYEFLGSIPMLAPPSYDSLTPLGRKFLDTDRSRDRRQLLQSTEFVCNPLIQYTLVLVTREDIARRDDKWTAAVNGSSISFGKLLTGVLSRQNYEVITNQDCDNMGDTVIEFAKELNMIDVDLGTQNLSLEEDFGSALRRGELGIFQLYNDIDSEVGKIEVSSLEATK